MQLRDADPWADAAGDAAGPAAVSDAAGKLWDSIASAFSSAVPPAPAPGGPSAVTPPIPNPGGPATTTQVKVTAPPVAPTPFFFTPFGIILIGLGAFAGWKVYKKRKGA